MALHPGKLYKSTESYLLLYPTLDSALDANNALAMPNGVYFLESELSLRQACIIACYWSTELQVDVRIIDVSQIFMHVSESDGPEPLDYCQVLCANKLGWICNVVGTDIERAEICGSHLEEDGLLYRSR